MSWLSQFFINPGLVLSGIGLILLPILIHLINRYRYRRVRWAAMEFLLKSKKQNQRQLLLQQLLLLFLRIVVVLGLVALVARPFFDPGQLQLLSGERSHHLVILDDSLSMQDQFAGKSSFEEGLAVVRQLAEEGVRRSGTQSLTLILLSRPAEPILTQTPLDSTSLGELLSRLEKLRVSHQAGDFQTAFQAASEHLRHPAAAKTLHLISDFRQRDWDRPALYASVMNSFEQQHVTINLIRTVKEAHDNLGIIDFKGDLNVAAVGVPLRLSCTVQNYGRQAVKNVPLTLSQDDRKLPLVVQIEEIEPGESQTRNFDVQFSEPGPRSLKIELPSDNLAGDNARYLAFDLAEGHPVLIVNGNPGDDEGQLLADALAPVSGLTGFAPLIEDIEYLRRHPLKQFQSIHLLNVPDLPPDSLKLLTEYVRAGGGLIWHLGPLIRTQFYNEELFQRGEGLFPIPLGEMTDFVPDATNPAPDLILENHPAFTVFQGQENPFVAQVKINRYYSVPRDVQIPASTRIIGRLSQQAPLFVEKSFGQGKILASLTSCGSLWNNWPRNPSYVLLQLEIEKYLAFNPPAQNLYLTGETLRVEVDPASYRNLVELRTPDPEDVTRLNLTPNAASTIPAPKDQENNPPGTTSATPAVLLQEEFRETDLPGIYRILRFRQDDTSSQQLLAFNVPAPEGEMLLASNDSVRVSLGYTGTTRIQSSSELDWTQGKFAGQEVRDLILLCLAGLLMGEQLLAMKLSFHPPAQEARS